MSFLSRFPSLLGRATGAAALGAGLVLSVLPAGAAHAQDAAYAAIDADPAIWHLSDADSDVYIFGTFHVLPANLDWQSDDLERILAEADTVYLEADVHSPEGQAAVQALVPQYGLNPPGVTLSSQLDAETNALLAEVAPTIGVAPAQLEPLRPWLAQVMLSVTQIQRLGFDPNAGVENALLTSLAGRDVEYGYFEAAEQQIRFFADLPEEIQVKGFEEGLYELERAPQVMDNLVRAWATGDMAALDTLINEEMRDTAPEVYDALIVRRNQSWVPQIQAVLEGEGVVLIAVGAAHLPGEQGVVELLRDRGITVSRQ